MFEYNRRSTFQLTNGDDIFESDRETGEASYDLRLVRDGIAKTWSGEYRLEGADEWIFVAAITDGLNGAPGPWGPDGSPSPSAIEHKLGEVVTIQQNSSIVARNFDPTPRGREAEIVLTNWSAPVQYDFVTQATSLVISEIHYNPNDVAASEANSIPDADGDGQPDWGKDDFEFIEIHNPGDTAASRTGVRLRDGVDYDFVARTMATKILGLCVVVNEIVSNSAAPLLDSIETAYGDSNLDGKFNSTDFVLVFTAGEYEDARLLNSNWEDGDWNGDGEFGTQDLVLAFQFGVYSTATRCQPSYP